MSVYGISGVFPFRSSTSSQNYSGSLGTQNASAEPSQQPTGTGEWPEALKSLSVLGPLLKKAKEIPESLELNIRLNSLSQDFYEKVLAEKYKLLNPPKPDSLSVAHETWLPSDIDLQKLESASQEHIDYLISQAGICSLIDLNLQNLKFDLLAFLQITPSSLENGIENVIPCLADSDVADQNIREKICQFLSSLCPKENEYSNVESLDNKLGALNPILQEQSRKVIRDLALMTQCGIFANRFIISKFEREGFGLKPLYHHLTHLPKAARLGFDVTIFLAAGANPIQQNWYGGTSLHYLSSNHHQLKLPEEILDLVLRSTKDIDARDTNKKTALHYAVQSKSDNGKFVQSLIEAGANFQAKDSNERTPLHDAAQAGNLLAIQILIEKYANKDAIKAKDSYGSTPLHYAVQAGNLEIVKALIAANIDAIKVKDNNGQTPLHHAVKAGNLEIVKALIAANIDAIKVKDNNGQTPLHHAVQAGNLEIVKALIAANKDAIKVKDNNRRTPLHYAVRARNLEIVEALIAANKDAITEEDNDRRTPLHDAAQAGNSLAIQILIEKCVNKDAIKAKDSYGWTPLHYAVQSGNLKTVEALIAANKDVIKEKDKNGQTPLHHAVRALNLEIVKALIAENKDAIKVKDNNGQTALHYAVEMNDLPIIKALTINVEADAINAKDNDGQTVLHYACKRKNEALEAILIAAGADINEKDNEGNTPQFYKQKSSKVTPMVDIDSLD